MISVAQAQAHIAQLITPLPHEMVALEDAAGRVLAAPIKALRDQPPFPASAMDGYAVRAADLSDGATLQVVDEVPAGDFRDLSLNPGQAIRIFTGAPVPSGADHILIQEDATRDGDTITLHANRDTSSYIRPAGGDFRIGTNLSAPRRLNPADIALAAAMGNPNLPVFKRPRVAIIATGDELVLPGETPAKGQIVASNSFGLKAQLESAGAQATLLPIARDTLASLAQTFDAAADADLIITIGGASVGERDLVAQAAGDKGLDLAFHKIAMRPGKPLMAGHLGRSVFLGLPGNPVSALVCGLVFARPIIGAMQGLGFTPPQQFTARLAAPLGQNGPREHYMRARLEQSGDIQNIMPEARQDSSLLTVLSSANALLMRPPNDPPKDAGALVKFIHL